MTTIRGCLSLFIWRELGLRNNPTATFFIFFNVPDDLTAHWSEARPENVRIMYSFMFLRIFFFFVLNFVVSAPSNGSLNATLPNHGAYCVEQRSWLRPDLLPKHCVAAAIQFFRHEAIESEDKPLEFLMPGAKPLSSIETRTTPRRYAYCKLKRIVRHATAMVAGRVEPGQPEDICSLSGSRVGKLSSDNSAINSRHYLGECPR